MTEEQGPEVTTPCSVHWGTQPVRVPSAPSLFVRSPIPTNESIEPKSSKPSARRRGPSPRTGSRYTSVCFGRSVSVGVSERPALRDPRVNGPTCPCGDRSGPTPPNTGPLSFSAGVEPLVKEIFRDHCRVAQTPLSRRHPVPPRNGCLRVCGGEDKVVVGDGPGSRGWSGPLSPPGLEKCDGEGVCGVVLPLGGRKRRPQRPRRVLPPPTTVFGTHGHPPPGCLRDESRSVSTINLKSVVSLINLYVILCKRRSQSPLG